MKQRLLPPSKFPLICLLAFTALSSVTLFAQGKPPAANPPNPYRQPPRYDIEIAEGKLSVAGLRDRINVAAKWGPGNYNSVDATLRNIVAVLRDLHEDVNLVMAPGMERIKINDLKMRAASLEQELEALRIASGNQFEWSADNGGMIDPRTGLPLPRKEDSTPLYILSPVIDPAGNRRRVEVFNLSGLMNASSNEAEQKKQIDSRLEEIEHIVVVSLDSLDASPPVDRPRFQFHYGANLLIVTGSPEALDLTEKIVKALGVPTASPMSVRIFSLKYANDARLTSAVQAVLTDKRSRIERDARSSQLVVQATESEMKSVEDVIRRLDVPQPAQKRASPEGAGEPGMPPASGPAPGPDPYPR